MFTLSSKSRIRRPLCLEVDQNSCSALSHNISLHAPSEDTIRKHAGSSFDEFLTEEGLLSEAEATATKRVIAYQLSQFMDENKLSKSAMARRMQTSRSALDRLLDASNPSVTLRTMDRAARALGKQLRIVLT